MSSATKVVRRSISLPSSIARRVESLARAHRQSAGRVLVDLVESGLEAKEQERKRFFALVDRLREAQDPEEVERLKREVAREVFGE